MRFLPYILKHLRRSWIRTASTVLAMAACIFLFCTLQSFLHSVALSLESASSTRLVTRHAVSLVFNLPLAYGERIRAVPGVRQVAIVSWFGGMRDLSDQRDFFVNFAVEAEPYLEMYPEYILPEDQKRDFLQDRRGCVVGRELAGMFGWTIGDSFSLESFIPPYRADRPFEFVIRAIYDTDRERYPGSLGTVMLFHHDYLYEMTGRNVGAGTYGIEIDDPEQAAAVSEAIDALFRNSEAETRTETEEAFAASFVSMAGNLALLLNGIALAVMFTILLVTANTMSMAVRERRTEIAVLKTLGFPSSAVMALVQAESGLLGALGGGLGVLLGWGVIRYLPEVPVLGDFIRGYFPNLALSPVIAAIGLGSAVALGLAAGFVPAVLAYRARITEALRQV
jgi:putative ABC transport system permease protein